MCVLAGARRRPLPSRKDHPGSRRTSWYGTLGKQRQGMRETYR